MSTLKKIGNAVDTGDEKGIIIAIAVALIIIGGVVAGYYIWHLSQPAEGFTDISVLDANRQTVNYGETLIVGQPTTYYVTVTNHEGVSRQYAVQLKVTNETISQFPVDVTPENTFTKTVSDGESWETSAAVTLHSTGAQTIVFELYTVNGSGGLDFTDNYLVLHVQGVNPS